MSRRFCAECGKDNVKLHDNFCEECYWKFNTIIDTKNERIEVAYCLTCLGPKLPTGWTNGSDKENLPEVVGYGYMRNIVATPEVDIKIVDVSDINWVNPNPEFFITYEGTTQEIDGFGTHSEQLSVEIKLLGGICKSCVRRKTGTHDVTVQIRAKNRKLSQEEIDKITNVVFSTANEMFHETTDSYVSDIIDNHGGLDVYLGNNSLADECVLNLKKIWIAHHEKNYKLITEEKDNKRVYRITHLFRLPHVTAGLLVIYDNELFEVKRIVAHSIKLLALRNREILSVTDWEKIIIPNPIPHTIKRLVISEDPSADSYLFMDLVNYEEEEYNKSDFPVPLEIGTEVEFILWNDKYYITADFK